MITKHKNRYKVFQVLPMYNVHPYFSLKNLDKKSVPYTRQNMVSHLFVHSFNQTWVKYWVSENFLLRRCWRQTEKIKTALPGVAQLVGQHLAKQRVASFISNQGACLGCRFSRCWGAYKRQPIDVSLSHKCFFSLSFSLLSPLSQNK